MYRLRIRRIPPPQFQISHTLCANAVSFNQILNIGFIAQDNGICELDHSLVHQINHLDLTVTLMRDNFMNHLICLRLARHHHNGQVPCVQAFKVNGIEMLSADAMDNGEEQRKIKSFLGHTGAFRAMCDPTAEVPPSVF